MSLVKLRAVGPDDLNALLRMAVSFNEEDGHPLSAGGRRALKLLCEGTPHGCGFMIERRGSAVGYLVIGLGFSIEYGGIDAFLDEFYVEPAHRGGGVGSAALDALDAVARRMKIKALHLEAMPQNRRVMELYARHGFREMGRPLMTKRY